MTTIVSRKKSTWINIIFKYLQLTLSIVSGIVLVPVYLRYLTTDQYGAWLTVGSAIIWLTAFDPGLANLLIQRIGHANGNGDIRAVRGYIYSGAVCGILAALIVMIVGHTLAPFAIDWLGIGGPSTVQITQALRVAICTTSLMLFGYSLTGASLGLQQSQAVGVIFLAATVIKVIVVLILLSQGVGLMSLPYSELGSAIWVVISGLFILIYGARRHGSYDGRIGLERLSELAGLFLFSLGARFSKVVTRNLDNVFISRALGPQTVVIYNLTATGPRQTENLLNLPVAGFRPAISHLAGTGDLERLRHHISQLLRYVFWGIGLTFVGLIVFNDDFIRLWVGKSRFAGIDVGLSLCLVFVVRVWSHTMGTLGFCLGDIRRNSIVEWSSSLLLIPGVIIGVKYGGLLGVCIAHIAVACMTTCWYFPWSLWAQVKYSRTEMLSLLLEIVQTIVSSLVCIILFNLCAPINWYGFLFIVLALVICYTIFILLLSKQARHELIQIKTWMLSRFSN